MLAWIFSDLHQEWPENSWDPAVAAPLEFDIVLCAGDVHMPLTRALDWLGERFRGTPVAYVPGNHDYWWDRGLEDRYTMADQIARGRDLADQLGIHLLIDDVLEILGVRILGSTLWTDFAMRPSWLDMPGALRMASSRDGMLDYRCIRTGPTSRHRLTPRDTLKIHRSCRRWLDERLAEPFEGSTLIVTHHAPAPASVPERNDDFACCYGSDLRDLMIARRPRLWVHGHVHRRSDYVIADTRVVCNPRGHIEENSGFDAGLTVEVSN